MKLNTIKNAYIKNKPNYNYEILDDDGILVAKGHLLSNRQKNDIESDMSISIDKNTGEIIQDAKNTLSVVNKTIIKSIDWWVLDEPINEQTIDYLHQDFVIWLFYRINQMNNKSLQIVEDNSKN